jgi:ABC-type Fe3+-siderophore transport system permease subunit
MKAEKISKYVSYALIAAVMVVLALFFFVGDALVLEQVSEATGEVTELKHPAHTDTLIYLCYVMTLVTLLLVLGFELYQAVKNLVYDPKGFGKSLVKISVAAVVVLVVFLIAPSQLDFVLYLQYALFCISALCMLGSFVISKIRS